MATLRPLSREQLDVLCQGADYMTALQKFAVERGPMGFNTWQRGQSQIRARFEISSTDVDANPPPGVSYAGWSAALWKEYMEDVFGPDWRAGIRTQAPIESVLGDVQAPPRRTTARGLPEVRSRDERDRRSGGPPPVGVPKPLEPSSSLALRDAPRAAGPAAGMFVPRYSSCGT